VGAGCSICAHPARGEIDTALITGASTPSVARDFGVGRSSVARHATHHLAVAIHEAADRRQDAAAVAILAKATDLYEHCAELLGQADGFLRRRPDSTAGITAATRAIRETRATLTLIADALDAAQHTPNEPPREKSSANASLTDAIHQYSIRKHGGRRLADGTIERVPPCPQCSHQPEPQPYLYPSVPSPEILALDPRRDSR
jgi:hypothetical protein